MRKRRINFLAVIIIAVMAVVGGVIACDNPKKDLSKPTELKVESKVLSWKAVDNASGYKVRVDGGTASSTQTALTYDITDICTEIGKEYKLQVMAVGNDKYKDSEWSGEYKYTLPPTVQLAFASNAMPSLDTAVPEEAKVTWGAVTNATSFKVTVSKVLPDDEFDVVDEKTIAVVSGTTTYEYSLEDLWDENGEYKIEIIAVAPGFIDSAPVSPDNYIMANWYAKFAFDYDFGTPATAPDAIANNLIAANGDWSTPVAPQIEGYEFINFTYEVGTDTIELAEEVAVQGAGAPAAHIEVTANYAKIFYAVISVDDCFCGETHPDIKVRIHKDTDGTRYFTTPAVATEYPGHDFVAYSYDGDEDIPVATKITVNSEDYDKDLEVVALYIEAYNVSFVIEVIDEDAYVGEGSISALTIEVDGNTGTYTIGDDQIADLLAEGLEFVRFEIEVDSARVTLTPGTKEIAKAELSDIVVYVIYDYIEYNVTYVFEETYGFSLDDIGIIDATVTTKSKSFTLPDDIDVEVTSGDNNYIFVGFRIDGDDKYYALGEVIPGIFEADFTVTLVYADATVNENNAEQIRANLLKDGLFPVNGNVSTVRDATILGNTVKKIEVTLSSFDTHANKAITVDGTTVYVAGDFVRTVNEYLKVYVFDNPTDAILAEGNYDFAADFTGVIPVVERYLNIIIAYYLDAPTTSDTFTPERDNFFGIAKLEYALVEAEIKELADETQNKHYLYHLGALGYYADTLNGYVRFGQNSKGVTIGVNSTWYGLLFADTNENAVEDFILSSVVTTTYYNYQYGKHLAVSIYTSLADNKAGLDGVRLHTEDILKELEAAFFDGTVIPAKGSTAPRLTAPLLLQEGTTLKWSAVANATSYKLTINGEILEFAVAPTAVQGIYSCNLSDYIPSKGFYEVGVIACSNSEAYRESRYNTLLVIVDGGLPQTARQYSLFIDRYVIPEVLLGYASTYNVRIDSNATYNNSFREADYVNVRTSQTMWTMFSALKGRTLEEAFAHPNWSTVYKYSIDGNFAFDFSSVSSSTQLIRDVLECFSKYFDTDELAPFTRILGEFAQADDITVNNELKRIATVLENLEADNISEITVDTTSVANARLQKFTITIGTADVIVYSALDSTTMAKLTVEGGNLVKTIVPGSSNKSILVYDEDDMDDLIDVFTALGLTPNPFEDVAVTNIETSTTAPTNTEFVLAPNNFKKILLPTSTTAAAKYHWVEYINITFAVAQRFSVTLPVADVSPLYTYTASTALYTYRPFATNADYNALGIVDTYMGSAYNAMQFAIAYEEKPTANVKVNIRTGFFVEYKAVDVANEQPITEMESVEAIDGTSGLYPNVYIPSSAWNTTTLPEAAAEIPGYRFLYFYFRLSIPTAVTVTFNKYDAGVTVPGTIMNPSHEATMGQNFMVYAVYEKIESEYKARFVTEGLPFTNTSYAPSAYSHRIPSVSIVGGAITLPTVEEAPTWIQPYAATTIYKVAHYTYNGQNYQPGTTISGIPAGQDITINAVFAFENYSVYFTAVAPQGYTVDLSDPLYATRAKIGAFEVPTPPTAPSGTRLHYIGLASTSAGNIIRELAIGESVVISAAAYVRYVYILTEGDTTTPTSAQAYLTNAGFDVIGVLPTVPSNTSNILGSGVSGSIVRFTGYYLGSVEANYIVVSSAANANTLHISLLARTDVVFERDGQRFVVIHTPSSGFATDVIGRLFNLMGFVNSIKIKVAQIVIQGVQNPTVSYQSLIITENAGNYTVTLGSIQNITGYYFVGYRYNGVYYRTGAVSLDSDTNETIEAIYERNETVSITAENTAGEDITANLSDSYAAVTYAFVSATAAGVITYRITAPSGNNLRTVDGYTLLNFVFRKGAEVIHTINAGANGTFVSTPAGLGDYTLTAVYGKNESIAVAAEDVAGADLTASLSAPYSDVTLAYVSADTEGKITYRITAPSGNNLRTVENHTIINFVLRNASDEVVLTLNAGANNTFKVTTTLVGYTFTAVYGGNASMDIEAVDEDGVDISANLSESYADVALAFVSIDTEGKITYRITAPSGDNLRTVEDHTLLYFMITDSADKIAFVLRPGANNTFKVATTLSDYTFTAVYGETIYASVEVIDIYDELDGTEAQYDDVAFAVQKVELSGTTVVVTYQLTMPNTVTQKITVDTDEYDFNSFVYNSDGTFRAKGATIQNLAYASIEGGITITALYLRKVSKDITVKYVGEDGTLTVVAGASFEVQMTANTLAYNSTSGKYSVASYRLTLPTAPAMIGYTFVGYQIGSTNGKLLSSNTSENYDLNDIEDVLVVAYYELTRYMSFRTNYSKLNIADAALTIKDATFQDGELDIAYSLRLPTISAANGNLVTTYSVFVTYIYNGDTYASGALINDIDPDILITDAVYLKANGPTLALVYDTSIASTSLPYVRFNTIVSNSMVLEDDGEITVSLRATVSSSSALKILDTNYVHVGYAYEYEGESFNFSSAANSTVTITVTSENLNFNVDTVYAYAAFLSSTLPATVTGDGDNSNKEFDVAMTYVSNEFKQEEGAYEATYKIKVPDVNDATVGGKTAYQAVAIPGYVLIGYTYDNTFYAPGTEITVKQLHTDDSIVAITGNYVRVEEGSIKIVGVDGVAITGTTGAYAGLAIMRDTFTNATTYTFKVVMPEAIEYITGSSSEKFAFVGYIYEGKVYQPGEFITGLTIDDVVDIDLILGTASAVLEVKACYALNLSATVTIVDANGNAIAGSDITSSKKAYANIEYLCDTTATTYIEGVWTVKYKVIMPESFSITVKVGQNDVDYQFVAFVYDGSDLEPGDIIDGLAGAITIKAYYTVGDSVEITTVGLDSVVTTPIEIFYDDVAVSEGEITFDAGVELPFATRYEGYTFVTYLVTITKKADNSKEYILKEARETIVFADLSAYSYEIKAVYDKTTPINIEIEYNNGSAIDTTVVYPDANFLVAGATLALNSTTGVLSYSFYAPIPAVREIPDHVFIGFMVGNNVVAPNSFITVATKELTITAVYAPALYANFSITLKETGKADIVNYTEVSYTKAALGITDVAKATSGTNHLTFNYTLMFPEEIEISIENGTTTSVYLLKHFLFGQTEHYAGVEAVIGSGTSIVADINITAIYEYDDGTGSVPEPNEPVDLLDIAAITEALEKVYGTSTGFGTMIMFQLSGGSTLIVSFYDSATAANAALIDLGAEGVVVENLIISISGGDADLASQVAVVKTALGIVD